MTLLNTADSVYVGDISADRVYLGDTRVWSASPYDPDTQAFLDASGLGEGYAAALDGLVRGLKEHGLWAKMKAVYPFAGDTADFHKWNLMDPRDADDAFRLTFTGGAYYDDLGYRANEQGQQIGSPNHADTHLVPLGLMNQDSSHLAYYSMEDTPPADRAEMGCYNWAGPASRFHIIARYLGANAFYYGMSENGGDSNVSVPAADGLFVATRTGPTAQAGYYKGVVAGSNAAPSVPLPPVPIYIGSINEFANRSDIPCGFASVGAGLDAQEVANLNAVVMEYVASRGNKPASPIQLPGLGLWLEADQIAGVTDGGPVATWPDLSGSDFHASTLAAPPLWKQVGIGGLPSVEFAPTPTKMSVGGWGTALSGKSEYTLFQVIRQDEYGTWPVITATPQDTLWNWITEYDPTPGVYWGHGNGCYRLYNCPTLAAGQPYLLTYSLGSGGPKFYLNGVEQTSWVFGPSGDMQPGVPALPPNVDLGGYFNNSLGLTGQIAAMVWYDKFLVDSDRQSVELHLMTKYGLGG